MTVLLGVAAAGLIAQGTQADPITGNINFAGAATLNGSLAAATAVNSVDATILTSLSTGSYVGATGPVTFNGFIFNPSTGSTPLQLWTFDSGVWDYSFELETLTVKTQNSSFLNITGTGVETITGPGSTYTPTDGTWTFTINNSDPSGAGVSFGFASETSTVPDGGATVALLGSALVGLSVVRRKLGA
jgi:hypothetical protein